MDWNRDLHLDAQQDTPESKDTAEVWPVPGIRLEQTQDLALQSE